MKLKSLLLFIIALTSVKQVFAQPVLNEDAKITVTLLQLNDVYEIAPIENGTVGGMARVATIRKKLMDENRNTYTILAGDFLFPSATGTMLYEGKQIKGRQMTDVMNAAGIDLVTFGNHEFDLKENELTDRINQSAFDWIGTNVWHKTAAGKIPFAKTERHSINEIPPTRILQFKDINNTEVKIGVFGMTINSTQAAYVTYDDYAASARAAIAKLKGNCDFIIAITHLSIDDDKMLAAAFPEIKLIIGGHEHVHSFTLVSNTVIAKADANARTVYVHKLVYSTKDKSVKIQSDLVKVDNTIPEDGATAQVVNKWISIADKSLRDQGFIPDEVLAKTNEVYDGRESEVRFRSTSLTRMIAKSISSAAAGSDCSMYNSGSIRLDDALQGTITQYDIIRTIPYGGKIVLAEMKGALLQKALETAFAHPANGCFLQYDRIERNKKGVWQVSGKKIQPDKTYRVAVNDYVVSGQQQYLEFLNAQHPQMVKITAPSETETLKLDLRKAVIDYLRKGGK